MKTERVKSDPPPGAIEYWRIYIKETGVQTSLTGFAKLIMSQKDGPVWRVGLEGPGWYESVGVDTTSQEEACQKVEALLLARVRPPEVARLPCTVCIAPAPR